MLNSCRSVMSYICDVWSPAFAILFTFTVGSVLCVDVLSYFLIFVWEKIKNKS